VLLAALWAVVPHALVQSMGYTETLFTAIAAWSLFALLRRHWLAAGLLCALAGLTRPTGVALVVATALAALVAVVRRRDGWRPWLAGALAPVGSLGYLVWVGHRLGRADGYLHVQKDAWRITH
jgi:Gpi18-like mannosyltransferase